MDFNENQNELIDKRELVDLEAVMSHSYVDYAMSVITARALPDVRDGLKPVQRRILHAMNELNNTPDKPHRKCARIVGDTMGKYHPHGDSSIYEALVKLAQDFNTRYPLVAGHGNFGSVDGDGAAAMRYTEARLSKVSMEMLADIGKDTVDFIPNFDDTEKEPTVLPAKFPNLLVNGTSGIAVGMSCNMPPHNMTESINACIHMLDNQILGKSTDIEDLIDIVKGPDFPTGGMILGNSYKDVYRNGYGRIVMEAVYHFEKVKSRNRIVFTEIPYQVNKAKLIEKIASLAKEKKIDGISDIRDESSREGLRIVVELKLSAIPELVLNELLKHTDLRSNFSANMLCLVNGTPKQLNLKEIIFYYLKHQEDVVSRRTSYELGKAEKREHIVAGLLIALDNIDEIVRIIRSSKNTAEAKSVLCEQFGFSDVQAQEIVDMRLRYLTGLEKQKLMDESSELKKIIERCKKILSDKIELLKVIKRELRATREKYGDERRTHHIAVHKEIQMEDMIPNEPVLLMRTHMGYVKRIKSDNFRTQNRGGMGSKGISTIDNDFIEDMINTTTHSDILFFTNTGKAYCLKVYAVPETGKNSRGSTIATLLKLSAGEFVTDMITVDSYSKEKSLVMVTTNGLIKKTTLDQFEHIRSNGLCAIKLKEDDSLCHAMVADDDILMLVTKDGMSACFSSDNVKNMGRKTTGSKAIDLHDGDSVVSIQPAKADKEVVVITEYGYGKRISCKDFRVSKSKNRKGVRCISGNEMTKEKIGKVVKVLLIEDDSDDLMVISQDGTTIRIPIARIPVYSRNAAGVKVMNLKNDSLIADIVEVSHEDDLSSNQD